MGVWDCRALLRRARNDSAQNKRYGHCEDPDEIGRRSDPPDNLEINKKISA